MTPSSVVVVAVVVVDVAAVRAPAAIIVWVDACDAMVVSYVLLPGREFVGFTTGCA